MLRARPRHAVRRRARGVAVLSCCALLPTLAGTALARSGHGGYPPAGTQGQEPPSTGQASGGPPGAQAPANQPAGAGGGSPTGSAPSGAGRSAPPGPPSHRQRGGASTPAAPESAPGATHTHGRERHGASETQPPVSEAAQQPTGAPAQAQTPAGARGQDARERHSRAGQSATAQSGTATTGRQGHGAGRASHAASSGTGSAVATNTGSSAGAGGNSSPSPSATGSAGAISATAPSSAAADSATAVPLTATATPVAASSAPTAANSTTPAADSTAPAAGARGAAGRAYRNKARGHHARPSRAGTTGGRHPRGVGATPLAPGMLASLAGVAAAGHGATSAARHGGTAHRRPAARHSAALSTTITRIVDVVPAPLRIVIALLVALSLLLALRSRLAALRTRRLERQRAELLADVGLLQAALLPAAPGRFGDVGTSVAYRPADGPAAGGDFYDVFALDDGRLAVILGDVSGHGRQALPHTALVRFTLRAYLEAGLSPRLALQTAGLVLERQLADVFATVAVATYDALARKLVYSCAGHPPPLVLGSRELASLTVCSAPPIGAGMPTGTRQTTIALPGQARVCFYTDGVTEARVAGALFGAERLARAIADVPSGEGAPTLLDAVARATDARPDDMAACLLDVPGGSIPPRVLSEELEVDRRTLTGERTQRFLLACGIEPGDVPALLHSARAAAGSTGSAVLELRMTPDGAPQVTLRRARLARLRPPAVRGPITARALDTSSPGVAS